MDVMQALGIDVTSDVPPAQPMQLVQLESPSLAQRLAPTSSGLVRLLVVLSLSAVLLRQLTRSK